MATQNIHAESYIEMKDKLAQKDKEKADIENENLSQLGCVTVWKRAYFVRYLIFFAASLCVLFVTGAILLQISLDRTDEKYDNEKILTKNLKFELENMTEKYNELSKNYKNMETEYTRKIKGLEENLTNLQNENKKLFDENNKLIKTNKIETISLISTGILATIAIIDDIRLRLQKNMECENIAYLILTNNSYTSINK